MENQHQKYDRLLEHIRLFCEKEKEIRAVMIVGSRARADGSADVWSDLDLVLFSTKPDKYLSSEDWVREIGPYWMSFIEKTAVGNGKERRVLFDDALDVDFSIFSVHVFKQLIENNDIQQILSRGIRVLMDKDGVFEHIPEIEGKPFGESGSFPSPDEWTEMILDFWYHAVWSAKKLLRGECWTAKVCIDHDLKQLVLKMSEWHAKAKHGKSYDTWHNGRFFDQWADPVIIKDLNNCFAHYDAYDMQMALKHTMDLFRKVAKETAQRLDYPYPEQADKIATEWVYHQLKEHAE